MENAIQIKIGKSEGGKTIVSARELYEQLKVETPFHIWFPRMVKYGFIENQDFALVVQKCTTNNPKNPYTTINDYAITIDMAKELCMIQRTPIGKQCRNYFIECERKLKETGGFAIPQTYAQALALAAQQAEQIEQQQKQLAAQNQQLTEQQPKVEYYDAVTESEGSESFKDVAQSLKNNVLHVPKFGQNKLINILREMKIIYGGGNKIYAYQKYVDDGCFEVVNYPFKDKNGRPHIGHKTLITQRGKQFVTKIVKRYFQNKQNNVTQLSLFNNVKM